MSKNLESLDYELLEFVDHLAIAAIHKRSSKFRALDAQEQQELDASMLRLAQILSKWLLPFELDEPARGGAVDVNPVEARSLTAATRPSRVTDEGKSG